MRLDPKKVRFYPPLFDLGIKRIPLRFSGKGCTLQLLETALIVEGNILKVGLFGLERGFQAALSEWSVLTVPYSRILDVKVNRLLIPRIFGMFLVLLSVGFSGYVLFGEFSSSVEFGPVFASLPTLALGLVLFFIRPRISIKVHLADATKTQLIFKIRSKKLRIEFLRKLEEYRRGAARFDSKLLADESVGSRSQGLINYGRSIYVVLAFSIFAILADYYYGIEWPNYQFLNFSQFCLLADTLELTSRPFSWFIMGLEWVVIPLTFLPFLSRSSIRVRLIVIGYAVLRLSEMLLGIYRVFNRREEFLLIGLPLFVMSLISIWWLLRLATKGRSTEGAVE